MTRCRMDEIIEDATPRSDWAWLKLETMRFLNSTPDAGRPSDAARCIVSAYQGGRLNPPAKALTSR